MTTTLYLAWQAPGSRRWFPVGRLDAEPGRRTASHYEFFYIEGAREARERSGLPSWCPGFLSWMRRISRRSCSRSLRKPPDEPAPARTRGIPAWVGAGPGTVGTRCPSWRRPSTTSTATGSKSILTSYADNDGYFQTQFVVHGLRYTNLHSIERTERLEIGEELRLSLELNNPVTGHAVTVKTADQYVIGWLPRYLVDVVYQGGGWLVQRSRGAGGAAEPGSGSLSHRVLVDFSGQLPPTMRSMDCLPQYRSIDGKEAN